MKVMTICLRYQKQYQTSHCGKHYIQFHKCLVLYREGGPEKLVGGFSYSLTIVLLIIVRSFALCTEIASSTGSRHCTICTVIWYGEKKNIESRLFFRSLWKWREMCKCLCSSPTSSSPCPCLCPRMSVD